MWNVVHLSLSHDSYIFEASILDPGNSRQTTIESHPNCKTENHVGL